MVVPWGEGGRETTQGQFDIHSETRIKTTFPKFLAIVPNFVLFGSPEDTKSWVNAKQKEFHEKSAMHSKRALDCLKEEGEVIEDHSKRKMQPTALVNNSSNSCVQTQSKTVSMPSTLSETVFNVVEKPGFQPGPKEATSCVKTDGSRTAFVAYCDFLTKLAVLAKDAMPTD